MVGDPKNIQDPGIIYSDSSKDQGNIQGPGNNHENKVYIKYICRQYFPSTSKHVSTNSSNTQ